MSWRIGIWIQSPSLSRESVILPIVDRLNQQRECRGFQLLNDISERLSEWTSDVNTAFTGKLDFEHL